MAQHRRDRLRHLGAAPSALRPMAQLLPRHIERVLGLDVVAFAEQRGEHAIGRLTRATSRSPAGRRCGRARRRLSSCVRNSAMQPRLAGAGVADEAHDLRADPPCMRSKAASSWSSSSARPTSGAASPWTARPRADRGSASARSSRCTTIGSALPRSATLAGGLEVEAMPRQRMGGCRDQDGPGRRRAETGGRPCSRCRPSRHRRRPPPSPRLPATTGPVWTAMCRVTGWPSRAAHRSLSAAARPSMSRAASSARAGSSS